MLTRPRTVYSTGKPTLRRYKDALVVTKEPGTKFGYSGGGFLVLQHLLEGSPFYPGPGARGG